MVTPSLVAEIDRNASKCQVDKNAFGNLAWERIIPDFHPLTDSPIKGDSQASYVLPYQKVIHLVLAPTIYFVTNLHLLSYHIPLFAWYIRNLSHIDIVGDNTPMILLVQFLYSMSMCVPYFWPNPIK